MQTIIQSKSFVSAIVIVLAMFLVPVIPQVFPQYVVNVDLMQSRLFYIALALIAGHKTKDIIAIMNTVGIDVQDILDVLSGKIPNADSPSDPASGVPDAIEDLTPYESQKKA